MHVQNDDSRWTISESVGRVAREARDGEGGDDGGGGGKRVEGECVRYWRRCNPQIEMKLRGNLYSFGDW